MWSLLENIQKPRSEIEGHGPGLSAPDEPV